MPNMPCHITDEYAFNPWDYDLDPADEEARLEEALDNAWTALDGGVFDEDMLDTEFVNAVSMMKAARQIVLLFDMSPERFDGLAEMWLDRDNLKNLRLQLEALVQDEAERAVL